MLVEQPPWSKAGFYRIILTLEYCRIQYRQLRFQHRTQSSRRESRRWGRTWWESRSPLSISTNSYLGKIYPPCSRVNLTKSLQVLIVSRKAQDSNNADETDDPQDSEHFRFLVARLSRIIRLELLYDNINNINYVQAERLFVFSSESNSAKNFKENRKISIKNFWLRLIFHKEKFFTKWSYLIFLHT